jgi:hypothetical protein
MISPKSFLGLLDRIDRVGGWEGMIELSQTMKSLPGPLISKLALLKNNYPDLFQKFFGLAQSEQEEKQEAPDTTAKLASALLALQGTAQSAEAPQAANMVGLQFRNRRPKLRRGEFSPAGYDWRNYVE